jgi:hypothetical protein
MVCEKVWKAELEVRSPTWYWAIRRMMMERPQIETKKARIPVGPMGNHDQKSKFS